MLFSSWNKPNRERPCFPKFSPYNEDIHFPPSAMTTTATLPDHFELHEGEEFDLHAVAKNGMLVITHVLRSRSSSPQIREADRQTRRDAAFKNFSIGIQPPLENPPTDEDPEDARLQYLLAKHLK